MKNIFATTSWRGRIKSHLPKVIKNALEFKLLPDNIKIYLSIEEFPNKEVDLPKEVTELLSSRVNIIWSEGNLYSFKRLLAIHDNPNCNLVIYDDDTLHSPEWFGHCISMITLNPGLMLAGWINLCQESSDLSTLYHYSPYNLTPNYYNTSSGIYVNTDLYKTIDLELDIPIKLGINDDDYYMNMINTVYGIKSKQIGSVGISSLIKSESDMRNQGYTHKKVLEYWKVHKPERFELYMKRKTEAVRNCILINSTTCK